MEIFGERDLFTSWGLLSCRIRRWKKAILPLKKTQKEMDLRIPSSELRLQQSDSSEFVITTFSKDFVLRRVKESSNGLYGERTSSWFFCPMQWRMAWNVSLPRWNEACFRWGMSEPPKALWSGHFWPYPIRGTGARGLRVRHPPER